MHETTWELLLRLKEANDSNDMGPAECWHHIGPAVFEWRNAGQPIPDLAEPEALPEGTCWTCARAEFDGDAYTCDDESDGPKRKAVEQWWDNCDDEQMMPPRTYNGPPCPGFEPR